ncbi:hypothetical protein M885DRAFT_590698 [Pelagophyceae sp. CCMP2097]|nr:hypothetical protein M885DRAFT_590698 [Pelagophyceae sp. CCMP2097]
MLRLCVVALWFGLAGALSLSTPAAALQTAAFAEPLWGKSSFSAFERNPGRVRVTVYNIGGGLTDVLSTTCSKKLPMIPHVGVSLYGSEYFYSDVIERRPDAVMDEMLAAFPQISFDLGAPTVSEAELEDWLQSAELNSAWQPDDYNVFDHNCNHFAKIMSAKVSTKGLDAALMDPVLAVTEEMLSELPEWRRSLGLSLMNQVTRLVVVSWGRATREKKERLAASAPAN